jgi:hypothetical protein
VRESTRSMNPTVARLDRDARRIGLPFWRPEGRGCNIREFLSASGFQRWVFKPGGKGVIFCEHFAAVEPEDNDGEAWLLVAHSTINVERAQGIMAYARVTGATPEEA